MSGARSHEEYRDNIGAYVLGALPQLEAAVLERHLASCESCRAEVEELRPVTSAIARSVPQIEPPASLKERLMTTVRAEAAARSAEAPAAEGEPERRRRERPGWLAGLRPRVAAAAALAVLALGIAIGVTADRVSHDNGHTISARINRTLMPSGSASLHVAGNSSNANVRLADVPQPRSGHLYEFWVQHSDGTITPGPTVRTGGDHNVQIPGGVGDAKAVMVTVESHHVPKPSGPVIMTFNV